MNPSDRKYTSEHEWIKIEDGSLALAGITEYAQDQLETSSISTCPNQARPLRTCKKWERWNRSRPVSDLFSPVTGEVVEVNERLRDHPELANEDLWVKAGCCGSQSTTCPNWTSLCRLRNTDHTSVGCHDCIRPSIRRHRRIGLQVPLYSQHR